MGVEKGASSAVLEEPGVGLRKHRGWVSRFASWNGADEGAGGEEGGSCKTNEQKAVVDRNSGTGITDSPLDGI